MQALFDFNIVDAKKLIRSNCHIDIVRLSCGSLFIQKTVHWIVYRGILQQGCHDMEQCLAKSCRVDFGCSVALGFMLDGLIYTGINVGKSSQCFPVGESKHIINLGDELRDIGLPNAIDAHYCVVFRKCGCQFIHCHAEPFYMCGNEI